MVGLSVTRRPLTNSLLSCRRFSMPAICGPPPCTTMGLTPDCLSRTISWAKAAPARHRPWRGRRISQSRSGRCSAAYRAARSASSRACVWAGEVAAGGDGVFAGSAANSADCPAVSLLTDCALVTGSTFWGGGLSARPRLLRERHFTNSVSASLPPGSMAMAFSWVALFSDGFVWQGHGRRPGRRPPHGSMGREVQPVR